MQNTIRNFLFLGLIVACVPATVAAPKTSSVAIQSVIAKRHGSKKAKKKNSASKHRKKHKVTSKKHHKKHKSSAKRRSSRWAYAKNKVKKGLLIGTAVVTAPILVPIELIALINHKGGFGVAGCV